MKLKTLLILVVLAALLGGWAWWTAQKKSAKTPSIVGTRVLPAFPINDAGKIQILSAGTNIVIAKTQGTWTVATRFNYPAKFEKVVDCIRELDELKVGQALTTTEDQLGSFRLLSPTTNIAPDSSGKTGTLIQIFDVKNQPRASLIIGKHFMHQPPPGQAAIPMAGMGAYSDGQYVRTGGNMVFLVAKTLDRLTENAKYWLDDEFVNIPAQDLMEMTVTGPDRTPISLRRAKESDTLTLDAINDKEPAADAGKINQLSGALNYLGFDDVAAPTLTAKDAGLDHPIIIKSRTRQGQLYTLCVGNTLTNDTFDRYAQVSVAYEAQPAVKPSSTNEAQSADATQPEKDDEAKAIEERTKALNGKLSSWIYVIKSYRVEPFLIKREEITKKADPPKQDAAAMGMEPPPADAIPTRPPVPGMDLGQGE
jgi:hypothetical protein